MPARSQIPSSSWVFSEASGEDKSNANDMFCSLLTAHSITTTMRAYYFDNLPGDQRLPHDCVPSRPVSDEALEAHNINFWHIPLDEYESKVDAIATARGYTNRELTDVSKEGLGEVISYRFENNVHLVNFFY